MRYKVLCLAVLVLGFVNFAGAAEESFLTITSESSAIEIEYKKLIQKLTAELPAEGMYLQAIDIKPMILQALIVSQGIPENEAAAVADNCIDGVLISAVRQSIKPAAITVIIVNFKNGKSAAGFDEMGKKVLQSEIAQFKTGPNASYNLIKEEHLKLKGFDFIRYLRAERITGGEAVSEISAVGTIGNIYVEMGFKNMSEVTDNDVLKFMLLTSALLRPESK